MRKTLLVFIALIVLASASLIFIEAQKAPQPPSAKISPVAVGVSEGLELTLNIGKNSFTRGENIPAILILKNTGEKEVSIEYFPTMPYNIYLYDKDGNLIETLRGEKAPRLRTDVLKLKPWESFSDTLNFSVKQPGTYQAAGAFIGGIIQPSQTIGVQQIEEKALVKTERISITIT